MGVGLWRIEWPFAIQIHMDTCMVGKGRKEECVNGKGTIILTSLSRSNDTWRIVVISEER